MLPTIIQLSLRTVCPSWHLKKTQLQGKTHSCKQSHGSQANLTKGPFSSVYKSYMVLCRNQRTARKQDFTPASAFCFWKDFLKSGLQPPVWQFLINPDYSHLPTLLGPQLGDRYLQPHPMTQRRDSGQYPSNAAIWKPVEEWRLAPPQKKRWGHLNYI